MTRHTLKPRRVAIVHDWLTSPGGAERVLRQMLLTYPEADLYTVCDFLPKKHRHLLEGRTPKTTFIQHMPFARTKHWMYLPLMPIAIEQFDLSSYDLVLSSSYCVAKGVLTGPDQTHLSYVHTPVRYAWHLQHQYLREMNLTKGVKAMMVRAVLHYLRIWDLRSAINVDAVVANSRYVAKQVARLYRQECFVLPPPVDLEGFALETKKEDYYITASRLVPYKRVDLVVKAFARMGRRRLIVVGDGPEMERVRAAARGFDNIQVLGYQPDDVLRRLVAKARAFVFAAIEDFGIAPLEAQASGTPVIALGSGGSLETMQPLESKDPTGVYFYEQTEEAIIAAVQEFECSGDRIRAVNCRRNAERFSTERFRSGLRKLVEETIVAQQGHDPIGEIHLLQAILEH
jgi:glycosyltransferase involved in cell wall biosynthesis